MATTAKTPPLETVDDLSEMLDHLWRHVDEAGRDRADIDVCFGTPVGGQPGDEDFDADAKLTGIDELAKLGVTWIDVAVPATSLDRSVEALAQFGETVIARS
jgi:hypothetical protein